MMEEYVWHYSYKGIVSMVRKGVRSTQETLPSLHSPTPPLPRSTLASFPFRNKLCFSVALDLLKIICYSPQSNMTCSYDFPHLAMIIEEELTAEWDVQSVSSWTMSPVVDYYNAFSLASNDLVLKRIQIGKLYDCRLKG